MINFYGASEGVLLLLGMVATVCFLTQLIAAIVGFSRYKYSALRWLECAAQVVLSVHLLIQALLVSQVLVDSKEMFIAASGYITTRYVIGIIMLILAAVMVVRFKKFLSVIALFAVVLTLPVAENLLGQRYRWVYILSLIFWLARSIFLSFVYRREIKKQISALSIKQAMDSLHSGLMYYRENGRIHLTNLRMQKLMIALTGEVQKNGLLFHQMIQTGEAMKAQELLSADGQIIYRLDDGTAWLFSMRELLISGKKYYQLSAVEITKHLRLTDKQRAYAEELRQHGERIAETIKNLDAICREEELLRISSDIHDSIAQRLAMIARILRSKEAFDETALIAYVGGILAGWRTAQTEGEPERIATIQNAYADIGVEVEFTGSVPKARAHADYFADFVREGIANAVRHGFASKVFIRCEEDSGCIKMSIENTGIAPKDEITEGSGIAGLRRKLAALGGVLSISISPRFTLTAVIDKTIPNRGGTFNDF